MPEPTVAAAGLPFVVPAAAVPVLLAAPDYAPQLVMFGIQLGLRADVLLAGFFGSVVGIAFFNAVPNTGDTWQALARDTWRRLWWSVASSVTAGYLTPLLLLIERDTLRVPASLVLSLAFVVGASAQTFLAKFIKERGGATRLPGAPSEGKTDAA